MTEVENLFDENDVRKGILGYQGQLLRNLKKFPNINGWDNIPVIRYEVVLVQKPYKTNDATGALFNSLQLQREKFTCIQIQKGIFC